MPASPAISPRHDKDTRFFEEEEMIALSSPATDHRLRSQSTIRRHSTMVMKREEFKDLEDERLVRDFAFWLSAAGEKYISERNFGNDLADGVALCTVMTKIPGSAVTSFHKVAPAGGIKSRENFQTFRRGCDRLCLPVTFGVEDLRVSEHPDVICTLIFLAHVCFMQGIETEAMNEALMEKIEEINEAMDEDLIDPMAIECTGQSIEEALADMHKSMSANAEAMLKLHQVEEEPDLWYQSVAKYLVSVKELREALKRSRQENVQHMLEKTLSFKNSLPHGVRTRLETLSEVVLSRVDSLPEIIKNHLPLETAKRLADDTRPGKAGV